MERKIQTKTWDKRVNVSILGMIIVDAYLRHKGCTGGKLMQNEFYVALLTELIENGYQTGVKSRRQVATAKTVSSLESKSGSCGWGLHITPTKRKRLAREAMEEGSMRLIQSLCRECGGKTVMVCSICRDELGEIQAAYCLPVDGRWCYMAHMEQMHKK
jgi:hypothetical protein